MGYLDNSGLSHVITKLKAIIASKQDALVSGTNIKTVNGNSLLGSGNIQISGSGTIDAALSDTSANAVQNKVIKAALDALIAVETLYDQSGWTVMRYGNLVMVQAHGASCSGSTTTACSYVIPAAYRPAYNTSNLIASTGTGVFTRLYINASTGEISTASVGTTSTKTWYGTLTYVFD